MWPIGTLFVLAFRDKIGWRGVWIVLRHRRADRLGVPLHAARIAALSGDPRQGQGSARRAGRLGIAGPKEPLTTDAASDTKSDPFAVVFKHVPGRVIAGMICFSAFFGVAIGLGGWLPSIMVEKGFTITKSLNTRSP